MALRGVPSPNSTCINRETAWVYLTLISGTFLAWIPLMGRSLPVADDFFFMRLIGHGGLPGYIHWLGFWRPLGQYLPFWLFLKNSSYHPIPVLLTHLLATILLFHVCQPLFGGIRLPLLAALVFAMFPFGYEAQTLIVNYNYVIPVPFFLANILLLARHEELDWPISVLFFISSALAILTALGHECLFFASIFSGLFALIEAPTGAVRVRRLLGGKGFLTLAPLTGCVVWLAMYYAFPGKVTPEHIHITKIHPQSILAVYYRQYSLLDVFIPWLSSVTRHFVFAGWSTITVAAVTICLILFLSGLGRLSKRAEYSLGFREATSYKLVAILALLLGASLIYALAGGFSLDSRKKYPLVPLLLLLGCWTFRSVFKKRQVPAPAFLACGAIICIAGAMTTWLVVGIWKYETARYNALAEFIAKHEVQGDIEVRWNPDLNRAWPQMQRSLGFRLDESWVLNLAVGYREDPYRDPGEVVRLWLQHENGMVRTISVAASDKSTVIEYDPEASRWVLAKR